MGAPKNKTHTQYHNTVGQERLDVEGTQHDFVVRALVVSDAGVNLTSAKSVDTSVADMVAGGGLMAIVTYVVHYVRGEREYLRP